MKRFLLLLPLLSCLFIAKGQETGFGDVMQRKAFQVTNKKGFRGQYLKGKRNGMGLLSLRDKLFYVGDFYRDEMTGYGMMIATSGNYVDKCAGCTIFVGNWLNGKKSGMGTCYDENGTIIYYGQFENDMPSGTYPSPEIKKKRQFALLSMDNGNVFLGETLDGNADGYGLILFGDGDAWLSSFKDGEGKGIGLFLFANGEWETFNFHNGTYTTVSSSENYRTLDAIKKQNVRDGLNEALLGISASLEDFNRRMEQINPNWSSSTQVDDDNDTSASSSTGGKAKSIGGKVSQKNNHANWKALDSAYGGYEDQLIKMKSSGNYDKQEVRNIQRKMKDLRKKIKEQSGHDRAVSSLENWNP